MAQMDTGSDSISRELLASNNSSEITRDGDAWNVLTSDGVNISLGKEGIGLWAEHWGKKESFTCCGIPLLTIPSKRRHIPYERILWAEVSGSQLTIHHARSINKSKVRPVAETYLVNESDTKQIDNFIARLLDRAYGRAQRRKRIKVIINPFGGKGKALKYWTNEVEPLFRAARCEIEMQCTTYSRHAEQIGEEMDVDNVDVVACCSGDGVPYEIWNGMARKKNARIALGKVAVVQVPCGTGNAMSLNCNGTNSPSKAALAIVKGVKTPIDLASITQGDRRTLSFLSTSLGIVAESDLGTENMRWLGSARFTVGFLMRILGKTVWPCDIAVGVEMDDKKVIEASFNEARENDQALLPEFSQRHKDEDPADEGLPKLRYGTISSPLPSGWTLTPFPNLGNFYAGNMPFMTSDANFFPFACISEGLLDLVTIRGDMSFFKAVGLLLAVGEGKLYEKDVVTYRKVSGFRIIPRHKEGYVSVDGERYPFEGLQVEVHNGLGCTLTPAGAYVNPDDV